MGKKRKTSNKKPYVPYFIVILLFTSIISLLAYILLTTNTKIDYFEEKTEDLHIEYPLAKPVEKIIVKKEEKPVSIEKVYEEIIKKPKAIKPPKPKIAIIIDDVSFKAHVTRIKDIGYPVTMAFLPPTPRHKDSAKLAQNLPFYMIHFPLEARSFKYAEINTLKVTDSYETMLKRVQELHILYPNATYTNNHTGSKFTQNPQAMDKFMKALKQYNFKFIDSRTTAKSVAQEYAKKHNVPFLTRNIFLDNKPEKKYIQNQLKKAIKIAKKTGFSIAICHPHAITLKTLKESKHLFKDVEPVLVNQL